MGLWHDPYAPTQEALNLELEYFKYHGVIGNDLVS
jgi:hypothetical protein